MAWPRRSTWTRCARKSKDASRASIACQPKVTASILFLPLAILRVSLSRWTGELVSQRDYRAGMCFDTFSVQWRVSNGSLGQSLSFKLIFGFCQAVNCDSFLFSVNCDSFLCFRANHWNILRGGRHPRPATVVLFIFDLFFVGANFLIILFAFPTQAPHQSFQPSHTRSVTATRSHRWPRASTPHPRS